MPPIVYTPAPGGTFPHTGGTIDWYNGHPAVPYPHPNKAATQWRLLVGSTQYGSEYHSGPTILGGQPLHDLVFNVARPVPGAICNVVPEYTLSTGQICYGTITTFTAV